MTSIYVPTPVQLGNLTLPADGEDFAAASMNNPVAALANGIKYVEALATAESHVAYIIPGSYTWHKPAGSKLITALVCGPGAGGSGGIIAPNCPFPPASGAGGGSGSIALVTLPAALVPDTVTVTVSAGGAGGAPAQVSGGSTAYSTSGVLGNWSLFGALVVASGGYGGDRAFGTTGTSSVGATGGPGYAGGGGGSVASGAAAGKGGAGVGAAPGHDGYYLLNATTTSVNGGQGGSAARGSLTQGSGPDGGTVGNGWGGQVDSGFGAGGGGGASSGTYAGVTYYGGGGGGGAAALSVLLGLTPYYPAQPGTIDGYGGRGASGCVIVVAT